MKYFIYNSLMNGYLKELISEDGAVHVRYTTDINDAYFSSKDDCQSIVRNLGLRNVEIQKR